MSRPARLRPRSAAPGRLVRFFAVRGVRLGGWLVFAALVGGWALFLRPTSLGGPAGYVSVSGTSMQPTLGAGDLVVTLRQDTYSVGDVVTYAVPADHPAAGANVIHRIVGFDEAGGYVVRGDNTNGPDVWHPKPDEVVGRLWLTVPGAGRLIAWLRQPVLIAGLAAALTVAFALAGATPARTAPRAPRPRAAWARARAAGRAEVR